MKTSRIAVTALVLALLTLACTASGAAGDPSDPFVSRDYVEGTFSDGVVKDAKNALAFTGEQLRTETANREKGNTGSFTLHSISSGSIVKLGLGDSIVLLSGAASAEVGSRALGT